MLENPIFIYDLLNQTNNLGYSDNGSSKNLESSGSLESSRSSGSLESSERNKNLEKAKISSLFDESNLGEMIVQMCYRFINSCAISSSSMK